MYRIHNLLSRSDYIYISILFILSFFINWHYAKNGVFPIDSFYHYDTGYRILNGEFPIKDYWVTTGIFVDFLEALFFYVFGTKWFSHILHSSILNGLIAVLVYFLFIKLSLKKILAFIFALLVGVLAYTSSGTPFVDHHATFLLLAGTIFLVLGIKTNLLRYWFLSPWFFGLSFLSKQVPSSYMIVVTSVILVVYFIIERNKKALFYLTSSSILFLFLSSIVIIYLDISFKNFYVQYILYPPSIGEGRLGDFKITFSSFFNHYKFIILPLILIIFFKIKNFKKDFLSYLLILSLILCLIFHQILTKNQIYIYFLSPFIFGLLTIEIIKKKYKFENGIILIIIIVCSLITFKYHERFNEKRKFHELYNVDLSKSLDSSLIHKSLSGLNWITAEYKENPEKEIALLEYYLKELSNDDRKKMVITHYLFFSSIQDKKLHSPSRSFTLDGASFPVKGNKYFSYYKNFFKNKIKKEEIEVIYIMDKNISENVVLDYLDTSCIANKKNQNNVIIFNLIKECFN